MHRTTLYARALRVRLLAKLGGKCALCGAGEQLEFDHIHGRLYRAAKMSYSARMRRYEREAETGLLRILCSSCNKKERRKNDNGQFLPTSIHPSLVPLTPEMPY